MTRMLIVGVLLFSTACSERFWKDPSTPDETDTDLLTDTGDTDVADTDTAEEELVDPIAEGREQPSIQCAGGGFVEGGPDSGAVCFAPVDAVGGELSNGTTSSSRNYQWQAGPTVAVSP